MTARRIIRHCQLQHPPGRFIPFVPGQILPADHEHIAHWFIVENSVAIDDPALSLAPAATIEETVAELAEDAALEGQGVTKESLLLQAKELGIEADGRWGLARLQAAIDAHLAA